MIHEQIVSEHKYLEKQIMTLQAKIKSFPDGKLICARNGTNYKWYHSDGQNKIYIPKQNRKLAEQLAMKKYLSLLSDYLSNEKKALATYLKQHKKSMQLTKPGHMLFHLLYHFILNFLICSSQDYKTTFTLFIVNLAVQFL